MLDAFYRPPQALIFLMVGRESVFNVPNVGADLDADATSVVPPNFFKPGSVDSLVEYIATVA